MHQSLSWLLVLVSVAACSPDPVTETPAPPQAPPTVPVVARWSDPASWPSGSVPVANADVEIPAGATIVLDTIPAPINRLTITGTLQVATDRDVAITARDVWVTGRLIAGTEAKPDLHRFTLTLTGADSGTGNARVGAKVLAIFSGGALELHGETRLGWTRLNASAPAGATQLVFADPVTWRAGDRLVVASTDFDPAQAEEAIVSTGAIGGVTLQQGLRYSHWGNVQAIAGRAVDERAEVALLTRNITVQGDDQSVNGFGGHIIVLQGGVAHVEGVTLTRMGQAGKVARYPMHWHMAGDVTGQYVRDVSIWKTNNRCLTIHGTDNATAQRNVCYDHLGHGYFLEDGSETGNLLEHNLGLVSRVPAPAVRILPSDATPATFWITNPDNTFRDNAAAGSVGFGFWFALPAAPTGLSTGQPDAPRLTPLREFRDNEAHSNRQAGLQVDNGPRADLTTETTSYTPRAGAVATGAVVPGVFQNFTGWKHSGRAVWIRGANLTLDGAVLSDNQQGATFANGSITLQHALVVGESANVTTAPNPSYPIRGFEFYDGTNAVSSVTFANFVSRPGRVASAIGYNRADGYPISQQNYVTGVQLLSANAVYLDNPGATKDGDKASLFVDADGSVSGTAGMAIVANNPFLLTAACDFHADWNAWACPQRYDGLAIQSDGTDPVAPLSIQRDDGVGMTLAGVPDNPLSAQLSILPARSYEISWTGSPPVKPRLTLQRAGVADWVLVSFPYLSGSFAVLRDFGATPLPAAASLAELDGSTGDRYYWDPSAQRIHAKIWVRSGRTSSTLQVTPK